jgi:hypothetical protein
MKKSNKVLVSITISIFFILTCWNIYNIGELRRAIRRLEAENEVRRFERAMNNEKVLVNRQVIKGDTIFFYKDDDFLGSSIIHTE